MAVRTRLERVGLTAAMALPLRVQRAPAARSRSRARRWPPTSSEGFYLTRAFMDRADEGEAYAARLREAGVPVTTTWFWDQIHGFSDIVGAGTTSRAASQRITWQLASRCPERNSPLI